MLALTKTKLKGNGEVSWCGVNGFIASVQETEKIGKDVAVLLKEVWHSAVIDFGCVSFKFSRVNIERRS